VDGGDAKEAKNVYKAGLELAKKVYGLRHHEVVNYNILLA